MPLDEGYTAEEQITGAAKHGGLQVVVYPMKAGGYEELKNSMAGEVIHGENIRYSAPPDTGIAPGGRMEQEIYEDPYGLDAWDQRHASRCFVNIANSAQWAAITGEPPPGILPSANDYTKAGLPWFDYYGGDAKAVKGSGVLTDMTKRFGEIERKGEIVLPKNEPVEFPSVVNLDRNTVRKVRETTI